MKDKTETLIIPRYPGLGNCTGSQDIVYGIQHFLDNAGLSDMNVTVERRRADHDLSLQDPSSGGGEFIIQINCPKIGHAISFRIVTTYGCCGMVSLRRMTISRSRLKELLRPFLLNLGHLVGAGGIFYTLAGYQEDLRVLLEVAGFKRMVEFNNPNTSNLVSMWCLEMTDDKGKYPKY